MKKFLLKAGIATAILALLLVFYNCLYVNTDYYKNLNDMGKFRDVPEHIDVVNFGASHSEGAFDWSAYTTFQGVNMALGAQTIVGDEALFDYYSDRLDDNSVVILELMFKSLYEEEPEETPTPASVTRYYQLLPRKYMIHWNFADALQYRYLPVLGNRQNALGAILEEWNGTEDAEQLSSEPETLSGTPTQILTGWSKEDMEKEGARRASVFMELSGEQEHGAQYEALTGIIEKCQANNIQVILVTVPTLPCFYESFNEAFLSRFYADVAEICEEYNLSYFDYTGDERFLTDYRWYRDTDHLNRYGAKVFTEQFLKDHADLLNLDIRQE